MKSFTGRDPRKAGQDPAVKQGAARQGAAKNGAGKNGAGKLGATKQGAAKNGRSKAERVPVALATGDEATGNWLRSIRFSGFSIMVLSLIVLFIVVLAPGLKIYLEQRAQVAELEVEVAEQQSEIDSLQDERARYNDPAYLKAEIRDRLFYVMPGETSFLVIDDVGEATPAETVPVSENIQETRVDWVSALFGSVMTAGLSELPPDQLKTTGTGAE